MKRGSNSLSSSKQQAAPFASAFAGFEADDSKLNQINSSSSFQFKEAMFVGLPSQTQQKKTFGSFKSIKRDKLKYTSLGGALDFRQEGQEIDSEGHEGKD